MSVLYGTQKTWDAGARETGFRAARGAFVVDTCDDDVMHPDLVSEMADAWQTRNVSLVTANAEYIDADFKSLAAPPATAMFPQTTVSKHWRATAQMPAVLERVSASNAPFIQPLACRPRT